MTYRSPFDNLVRMGVKFNEQDEYFLCYRSTLAELLSQTKEAVSANSRQRTLEKVVRTVLHPPRIIRALLDYKIFNSCPVEDIVQDAIQIGLRTYKSEDTFPLISQLETNIAKRDPHLPSLMIMQKCDPVTWKSSQPQYSKVTSTLIAEQTQNDLLFIALAHGGVAAGMDVFLRYCNQVHSYNSSFYAVRYSQNKKNDTSPKLSRIEKEMLPKHAKEKDVVLFDEDCYSGKTLAHAKEFFQEMFSKKNIIVAANYMTTTSKLRLCFNGKF